MEESDPGERDGSTDTPMDEPDGGSGDGDAPGPDAGGDGDAVPDAGEVDARVDAGDGDGGDGDGPGDNCDPGCPADKPLCVDDGVCLECYPGDTSHCEDNEVCAIVSDEPLGTTPHYGCVPVVEPDPYRPWELDCQALPAGAACEGGPRKVLLVTHQSGRVAMFDPADGHFLGYFRDQDDVQDWDSDNFYWHAQQGPDQCVWMVNEGERGVERYDTDGTFKDQIIDPDDHFATTPSDGLQPVLEEPRSIAFTREEVYVASTRGTPEARIARFSHSGAYDKVVLEDGSEFNWLTVLGDGSFLIADDSQNRVARLTDLEGEATGLASIYTPGQIAYLGDGTLALLDSQLSGSVITYELDTEASTEIVLPGSDNKWGLHALENGRLLVTGGTVGISSLDLAATHPDDYFTPVLNDAALAESYGFKYIGSACLSEAFVASRAPTPPETTCPGGPATTPLYSQDFEEGDFTGTGEDRQYDGFFDVDGEGGDVEVSLDTISAGTGQKSLRIVGGEAIGSGVYREFASIEPSYISYFMRLERDDIYIQGFFRLLNEEDEGVPLGALVANDEFQAFNSSVKHVLPADQWVRVEMRNIDWTAREYDLYIDCVRVAEDIQLQVDSGDNIDRLELFNNNRHPSSGTPTVWYDEITFR